MLRVNSKGLSPIIDPQCVEHTLDRFLGGTNPQAAFEIHHQLKELSAKRGIHPRTKIHPDDTHEFRRITKRVNEELGIPLARPSRTPGATKLERLIAPIKAHLMDEPISKTITAQDTESMTFDEFELHRLRLRIPCKETPDVAVEFVLHRHEYLQRMGRFDDTIYTDLFRILQEDPLRFHSELGIRFYLKILEVGTDRREQHISELIKRGQKDERAIPMVNQLIQKHISYFTEKHMPGLFDMMTLYPRLTEQLNNFKDRPNLLLKGMESCFDDHGHPLKGRTKILDIAWSLIKDNPRKAQTYREKWFAQLQRVVSGIHNWKALALWMRTAESSEKALSKLIEHARQIGSNLSEYSTPFLTGISMALSRSQNKDHQNEAKRIINYLKQNRTSDYKQGLKLFAQKTHVLSDPLKAILARLRTEKGPKTHN